MDFKEGVTILNTTLSKKEPRIFNSSWILKNAPRVYSFISKNVRTENNEIDWDKVTRNLNGRFWKRWQHPKKSPEPYRDKKEVHRVLRKYKDKLYTFVTALDLNDKIIRDTITISLVRLAQNGNLSAKKELIRLLKYPVDYWIENCWKLNRWRGYEYQIESKIDCCIRRYRYTGSFMAYLFKTLEYSSWGFRPLHAYSLNENIKGMDNKTRMDYVVQDPETGEARMYDRATNR